MRIKYIDYARALCMLWIVGFWHLGGYPTFSTQIKLLYYLQKVFLLLLFIYQGTCQRGKEFIVQGISGDFISGGF